MKIVFDGTEYEGAESMPPEVRQRFQAALAAARAAGLPLPAEGGPIRAGLHVSFNVTAKEGAPARAGAHVDVKVKRRIVYNGVEYPDADHLPADAREVLARYGRAELLAGLGELAARKRSTADPAPKRALLLLLGALVTGLVLYLAERPALEYTFDDNRLFIWGLAFGILAAVGLLRSLLPTLPLPAAGRWIYAAVFTCALTAAGTALAGVANQRLARGTPETWTFTVTAKRHTGAHGRGGATWDVWASAHGRALRFAVPADRGSTLLVGQRYAGQVRRGFLGYPFLLPPGLH